MLRKYYKLKTYSKPLHLILTSNFPYILNHDQSKYSKRCWNCTNERKGQKFACDSTKESTKEGLICSVREEPNSVQPCQFRFLTNHCQARAANPRKQPEKLGWESGVFSGALRNAFRDPRNSPEKSPEKSSGPRSFRVFWETHARSHTEESAQWRHSLGLQNRYPKRQCYHCGRVKQRITIIWVQAFS